jgi:hypothetical protein
VSAGERTTWRAFPWDESADGGKPFSTSFVPATQGWGRFDLPGEPSGVLYLAETREHAVGEKVQDLRNQVLEPGDLDEHGHPLALVEVTLSPQLNASLVNLCDPGTLARLGVAPDAICAQNRATTQSIGARLHEEGVPGFRWWSSFFGEWHTLVLFRERLLPTDLRFGLPEIIDLDHPALAQAAAALGIGIGGGA